MTTIRDTYTRRQGLRKTYEIEYEGIRYKISLDGKLLKEADRPPTFGEETGVEATFFSAVSSIEHLQGMSET